MTGMKIITHYEQDRLERFQLIAEEMGCYTSSDLEALYDLSANSLAIMRSKGTGPDFIVLGRNALYPKESVHTFIRDNLGQRSNKARPQKAKFDSLTLNEASKAFAAGLAGKAGKP